ncbi:MAG: hypothetical protein P8J17_02875 [Halioglobus sp.]|nr:hypothetical protein [Halioglobus sp.]
MNKTKICNTLEVLRWVGFGLGIFFAQSLGQDPIEKLNLFSIWAVISIAGLTGLESVFLADTAAKKSGYGSGSPYQRQSGFNNLALALTTALAHFLSWGIYANAALLTALLIFLTLSAANHAYSAFKENNREIRNFLRPLMTIFLLLYSIPFILSALKFTGR